MLHENAYLQKKSKYVFVKLLFYYDLLEKCC